MRRSYIMFFTSLMITVFAVSCSDEGSGKKPPLDPVPSDAVSDVQAADVANNRNGTDLQVSFTKAVDETKIGAYRVIVVKTTAISGMDTSVANNLPADRYFAVAPTGANIITTLPALSKDSDGDLLIENLNYGVVVLSVADGFNANQNVLSSFSGVVSLSSSPSTVTGIVVEDKDNNGDGSDLSVTFNKAVDEAKVNVYRVLVVKSADAALFDLAAADAVVPANYTVVTKTGSGLQAELAANANDVDGETIASGVAYKMFVLVVADGTIAAFNVLSSPSAEFSLTVTNLVKTLVGQINIGSGGMDVDAQGNIYAADFGAALNAPPGTFVMKITPQGVVTTFATGLVGASGNDFDSQGNLMQSNIGAGSISKILPNGTNTTFVGPGNGILGPVGIVADPNDTLYVCNCSNNTIQKVNPLGFVTQFLASNLLSCPNGITRDTIGNLYVANFNNGNVIKITPDGTASVLVTLPGNNNGHILYGNDVLYVVARSANQLYKVTLAGQITLLAGTGTRGLKDGSALNATLSLTNDVALSPDGKILYFNDVVSLSGSNIISPVTIRMVLLDAEE